MKKLISILLSALMLASMSTVSFADGYNEETGEYVWDFNDLEEGVIWAGGDGTSTSGSIKYEYDEEYLPNMRVEWRCGEGVVEAVEFDDGNMALKLEMTERISGGHFGIRGIADMAANPDLKYYELDIMWDQGNSADGATIAINSGINGAGRLWSVGTGWFDYGVKEWIAGSLRTGVWYHVTAEVENGYADTHLTADDGLTDVWQYDVPVTAEGMLGVHFGKIGHQLYIDNMKIGYTPGAVEPEAAYGDITFAADGNNVTASMTATAAAEGQTAKFILAVTDIENNKLVAIDIEDVTTAGEKTTTVAVPTGGDYEVQAFLWDDDLVPLANSGIVMN